MRESQRETAAGVLLEFQAVMEQFLELQADVIGAFAAGRPPLGPVLPVEAPPREQSADLEPSVPAPTADTHPSATTATPASDARPQAASHQPAPEAVASARSAPGQSLGDATFSRYTLAVRERPAQGGTAPIATGHVVAITDDTQGVAAAVAARLRSQGLRVALISSDRAAADPGPDGFLSPLDSVEDAEQVVERIGASCGPIGALIHLAPLAPGMAFDALDADEWWRRLSHETRALFVLSKALASPLERAAAEGGAALIAVTSMGGCFGTDPTDGPARPSQGGVAGFVKCAAIEWPAVRVRAVDLDPAEPIEGQAGHVIDELWSADRSVEIGYAAGRRVALDVVPAPARIDPTFAIPSDAVVLATGGARGITAEVCLELAERYQPTFIIVGQTPRPAATEPADTAPLTTPADLKRQLMARFQSGGGRVTPAVVERAYRRVLKEREIRETISRLSAAGARVHYVQLDVQDEQAFGALIDEVYDTYGRLDGVIHGAGIIEDKLVRDKSLESFDRVFRTKTIGTFVLSRRLRPESLRFAVFFSSVAGRFGNRGQADYAAANEVVGKVAAVLQRRWPGRVCSMAWAPWDRAGMVSPELKREFARRGVELLSPAAGRRALWQEIQQESAAAAELVIGGQGQAPDRLATGDASDALPLLKHATRDRAAGGPVLFQRRLDPSVDLYLDDHRLDGRPVLPLAFATEFMAEAAQASRPDLRVVAVRGLQLLKGIVVDAEPVPLTIAVGSAADAGDGLLEAVVEIRTPGANPPVRYRSVVQMASMEGAPSAFAPPSWSLVPLARSLERAYADWTFHGPLFQRVTDIVGIGANAMVATVYSSSAIPVLAGVARPAWTIDPFVFDAALQLLLMWSRARNDKTALPSRFRSFTRYAPLSDEPLTCYVAVESLAGGHALKSTVHFVDAAGRLLAVLDAMEASCTNALNRLAGAEARGGRS